MTKEQGHSNNSKMSTGTAFSACLNCQHAHMCSGLSPDQLGEGIDIGLSVLSLSVHMIVQPGPEVSIHAS